MGLKELGLANQAKVAANEAKTQASEVSTKVNNVVDTVAGKNLFNPDTRTIGYFINDATGNLVSSASYDTTDYIPIVKDKKYAITKARKIAFYNSSKTFQSAIDTTTSNVVTAPVDGFMRVSFFAVDINTSQIEEGSSQTLYEPYKKTFTIKSGVTIPQANIAGDLETGIQVSKNGDRFDIASRFGDAQTIILETVRNGSLNSGFRFLSTKIDGEMVHNTQDDITPIRTFSTVGANHGYVTVVGITMANHGKTTADLGSKWTDGTTTYTLLDIDGNNLTFGCPYTVDANGVVTSTLVNPTQNLTHVSGATNTAAVDVTTRISGHQLKPSVNNKSVEYVLDGKKITTDGTYSGKELQVQESYTVMDYKAIIDYAQANIGKSFKNDSIEGVVRLSIIYTFTKGGKCFITHNFKVLKKVSILTCGFLQSVIPSLTGHTVKRYMPNVVAKSGVDFKQNVDMTTYNQSLNFYKADYTPATKPPNRYVDSMYDANGKLKMAYTMGYLIDKSNTKNADRIQNTDIGWDMRDTKKSYPVAMNALTFNPGDYKTFMGYRNYISPSEMGDATNVNIVRDKKDTYVYIDYHTSVSGKNIKLPNDIGKTVSVVDSENFTLLNDVVDSDGVTFSIANNYGYAVLKLN